MTELNAAMDDLREAIIRYQTGQCEKTDLDRIITQVLQIIEETKLIAKG